MEADHFHGSLKLNYKNSIMIHIRWFNDDDSRDAVFHYGTGGTGKVGLDSPWLCYSNESEEVDYNKTKLNPYHCPLTFKALENNSQVGFVSSGPTDEYERTIFFSVNGGNWGVLTMESNSGEYYWQLNSGDTISFAGDNDCYYIDDQSENVWMWGICADNGSFEVCGNIMSMIDSTEFYNIYISSYTLSYSAFRYFFQDSTAIVDASNLVLPAEVGPRCYSYMFYDCTYLVYPPKVLPATTLATGCYEGMFNWCHGLVRMPKIAAQSASHAEVCMGMFEGCQELKEVQDTLFPQGVVGSSSCSYMFNGCTSLVKAPELPATTIGNYCYNAMFQGCTSLLSAPSKLPATTLKTYCYQDMFNGCTVLERAPELPARYLSSYCYKSMFYNCTNLHYVKSDADSVNSNNTYNWLYGVANIGKFESPHPTRWLRPSPSGIPSGWESELVIWIDDYPETLLEYDVCQHWQEWESECYVPEAGNGFMYMNEVLQYNGETFYLWKNVDYNPDDDFWDWNINSMGNYVYALTRTIDFNILSGMAVEDDFEDRRNNAGCCPIYAFLNQDFDESCEYSPDCNDEHFVLSCVRH
jgi:hypothetical protein